MEPVSGAFCEQWHGAIAVDALGALEPAERAGLLAHLDGCAQCRETARELAQTASVLALVDPSEVGSTAALPPNLTERVLGTLHDDALAARRRQRTRMGAVVTAVAAIAASLALLVALGSPSTRSSRTEVLSGSTTAAATAVLSERSWGTAISFTEQGLPPGGTYIVSMRTSSGAWWTAGSFGPKRDRTVTALMSCYVQLNRITGIRVTNAKGIAVLWSLAPRGTSW